MKHPRLKKQVEWSMACISALLFETLHLDVSTQNVVDVKMSVRMVLQ